MCGQRLALSSGQVLKLRSQRRAAQARHLQLELQLERPTRTPARAPQRSLPLPRAELSRRGERQEQLDWLSRGEERGSSPEPSPTHPERSLVLESDPASRAPEAEFPGSCPVQGSHVTAQGGPGVTATDAKFEDEVKS